jgi:hypothetical protein
MEFSDVQLPSIVDIRELPNLCQVVLREPAGAKDLQGRSALNEPGAPGIPAPEDAIVLLLLGLAQHPAHLGLATGILLLEALDQIRRLRC